MADQYVQLVVPAGVWQGTRLIGDGKSSAAWLHRTPASILTITAAAATRSWQKKWPEEAERIKMLTRS